VRSGFVDRMTSGSVSLVAPSQSVLDNLIRLEPRFGQSGGVVIPHGQGTEFPPSSNTFNPGMGRLKLLVLGMLASSKGLHLLTDTIDSITPFADVYLLGSGEMGALFEGRTGVHVLGPYRLEALPEIVTRIQPHIGLLMSVCEETFSYTLGELMRLGIPPVATRVGSFPERIRHGVTGFLYDPTPAALLVCLHDIDSHRSTLKTVHQRLLRRQSRSALEMVEDYHRLLPLTARSPSVGQPARRECEWLDDPALIVPYIELSNRWKESKRLHLSMTVKDMLLADAARQREALAASLREQTRLAESRLAQIEAIHASTSWRVTRPIRQARILARFLRHAFRQPTRLPGLARHLLNAGHAGGRPALKLALLHPPTPASQPVVSGMNLADPASADSPSLEFLDAAARSTLISRIETMRKTPRISVLIPTYNTPEAMLRATLDSVRNQLYPHWQLCVADDASTLPHVRTVLQDLAAADSRVRLDFAATNGGVACASNRALAMAEGEFTVLLDHDDLLEPQALFRVAEAIVEDAPDMLYSDEWLVDAEATHVVHTAYRPTFSPEYLRSHPYIVHLLGFRTGFLRELGGFDETLRISQDYDLVLRASEKARTIVHVPEPLYLWRTHPNSAGHAMQDHVMATSRAILERHLARCGEAGRVEDGAAFNFFDVRYPLQPGLKVAILIPTRNHADLVRACLDSLAWTLREVAHDIVLIDHDSDDPVARAYFDSLAGRVRLLRHSGPFNFSAINNRAVAQLDAGYSHYLFLNNDIEAIEPGWLERMLELGQKADVGAVGAKLFYPDGRTIQHAGVAVPCCGVAENLGRFHVTQDGCRDEGYNGSLNCNREVSAVTAACLLIQARVFHEIGGFDESLAVGFGDVDLCLRIGRRGYRNLFCAHAVLLHHESKTRGRMQEDPHPEDTERFMAKWADLYTASDPYFNPNLSGETPDWQAIMPPALNLDLSRRVYLSNKLA
jgi:GT2 family glycosyltransferase